MMTVESMWQAYLSEIGTFHNTRERSYQAWHFSNHEKEANHLANLTLKGIKRATAALKKSYDQEGESLPKVKDLHIITDFKDKPVCIIEVTDVKLIPFNKVSREDAKKEGEGDGSLEHWKTVHRKFFKEDARELAYEFTEEDLVVFMTFKVVYPCRKNIFYTESLRGVHI